MPFVLESGRIENLPRAWSPRKPGCEPATAANGPFEVRPGAYAAHARKISRNALRALCKRKGRGTLHRRYSMDQVPACLASCRGRGKRSPASRAEAFQGLAEPVFESLAFKDLNAAGSRVPLRGPGMTKGLPGRQTKNPGTRAAGNFSPPSCRGRGKRSPASRAEALQDLAGPVLSLLRSRI